MKILGINISARKFKVRFRTDPLNTVVETVAASMLILAALSIALIFICAAWQSRHPQ